VVVVSGTLVESAAVVGDEVTGDEVAGWVEKVTDGPGGTEVSPSLEHPLAAMISADASVIGRSRREVMRE
jgi:hypothetical protein